MAVINNQLTIIKFVGVPLLHLMVRCTYKLPPLIFTGKSQTSSDIETHVFLLGVHIGLIIIPPLKWSAIWHLYKWILTQYHIYIKKLRTVHSDMKLSLIFRKFTRCKVHHLISSERYCQTSRCLIEVVVGVRYMKIILAKFSRLQPI